MSNITLHAATEEVRALLDQVDSETGELPPELEQARELVATKAVSVAAYIIDSERQAEMGEAYAKELTAKVKTIRNRAAWLRRYLSEHMAAAGIAKISDARGIFSARLEPGRDKSVDVFDASQVPADYMREVPATSAPDKALIKKAIGDGFDVPGARIVARDRLTIA